MPAIQNCRFNQVDLPGSFSVGQTIDLSLTVTNVHSGGLSADVSIIVDGDDTLESTGLLD